MRLAVMGSQQGRGRATFWPHLAGKRILAVDVASSSRRMAGFGAELPMGL
jgi:hypothetical protein